MIFIIANKGYCILFLYCENINQNLEFHLKCSLKRVKFKYHDEEQYLFKRLNYLTEIHADIAGQAAFPVEATSIYITAINVLHIYCLHRNLSSKDRDIDASPLRKAMTRRHGHSEGSRGNELSLDAFADTF